MLKHGNVRSIAAPATDYNRAVFVVSVFSFVRSLLSRWLLRLSLISISFVQFCLYIAFGLHPLQMYHPQDTSPPAGAFPVENSISHSIVGSAGPLTLSQFLRQPTDTNPQSRHTKRKNSATWTKGPKWKGYHQSTLRLHENMDEVPIAQANSKKSFTWSADDAAPPSSPGNDIFGSKTPPRMLPGKFGLGATNGAESQNDQSQSLAHALPSWSRQSGLLVHGSYLHPEIENVSRPTCKTATYPLAHKQFGQEAHSECVLGRNSKFFSHF